MTTLARLVAEYAKAPAYFVTTDWVHGKHVWIVGRREGGILCYSQSHKTLITNLKRYMKRHGVARLEVRWDSDGTTQVVQV